MYRLLIVDDENYIVDSLSTMFESRKEHELDVYRAYSAEEALGWLNRAKIDIIITDIKMQEMSGVELAKKVKLNWPHCKIIFLTAYAEFDYAYEAIRNNVIGYILKTENEKCILAEVDKAIELLDKEVQNLELMEHVQEHFNSSLTVIRKEIISNILKENYHNLPELFEQLKSTGTGFAAGTPFLMVIGRIENSIPISEDIVGRFRQFSSIQKTLERYFGKYYILECVEYALNKIVCLMQLRDCESPDNGEIAAIAGYEAVFVAGMLETVQQTCMNTANICISFILHGVGLSAGQLPDTFQSMNRFMKLHSTENSGFILTDTAPEISKEKNTLVELEHGRKQVIPDNAEKLKTCLENGSRDVYMEEFGKIAMALGSFNSWHNNAAWEIYYSVAGVILSFINQRNLEDKLSLRISLNIIQNPRLADSWNNVAEYLQKVSEDLFDLLKTEQQESSGNIVHFLKEYILKHITEDVSLIKLSEVSGYNAIYLTRVFKKNTGETINEYIFRKKLGVIKELMADKSLSIGDVAERAGFEYRSYFNKFLKKTTGMSPQEFRKHLYPGITV